MSPTVHASSRMPRFIQTFRGKAPKDGTSWLALSNMKTFMTPDDPYRSAAKTCRTHNSMFIVWPLSWTMSASNCSDGPNSRPQLFTKPFVSGFIGESRMPRHEIRKELDLTRCFHDAHTSHGRSDLRQSARHGKNQVSLCDGKDRGQKEGQSKGDVPLGVKLRQSTIHQSLLPLPNLDKDVLKPQILFQRK